ncbi:MAG TPA: nuclear transport factor 2 family protein [Candidatus Limnocylindria bacterium]|nr:nuclear transport factor 2 family protein [Candidatus Limnocylindria bacterium]
MTELLRELADRQAIRDLVTRYACAVDRRDFDAVAACFTPDAETDYTFFAGPIAEVLEKIRAGVGGFAMTMHVLGNHLAEVRGDTATSETYAVCYHRRPGVPDGAQLVVAMRYLDELVRTPAGWRIRRRRATVEWQQHEPPRA